MKLQVKILDITSSVKRVLLNATYAKKQFIQIHDRVEVKVGECSLKAIVDLTNTVVEPGEVGIFSNMADKLKITGPSIADVTITPKPTSIKFIRNKMQGKTLQSEEIHGIVRDIVEGNLSQLETAAFVMAEHYQGMNIKEIEILTRAIAEAGDIIDFEKPVYDKHSIGGVPGNKVSLVIVPIIAAAGLLIPKTSSRAITSPSGTADTMELLAPVDFDVLEVQKIVKKTNGAIVWGGALNLAPADDIIIQVERPLMIDPKPQMMASIMSKKVAMGVDFLILDIPVGRGAKMETLKEGREFSQEMIELGNRLGIKVECGITYGGQPVGHAIGPALEAREALEVLQGNGPDSVKEKSTALAGVLLEMGGLANYGKGKSLAMEILSSGKALKKMRGIIAAQGGDPKIEPKNIDIGENHVTIQSPISGFITQVNNYHLKQIARIAGAPTDKGSGLILHGKRGTKVAQGEILLDIYAEKSTRLEEARLYAMKNPSIIVEGMLLERLAHGDLTRIDEK